MPLRPATNEDTEQIRTLIFDTLAEYGLRPDPQGIDADLNDIEASYAGRGGFFEVFEDSGGRIVGTVGLYPLRERDCELRKMYLARHLRGRGLGKQLLERVLAGARAAGFARIRLETASVLAEAIQLYQQYGFRPVEADELAARCDQAYVLDLESSAPDTEGRK